MRDFKMGKKSWQKASPQKSSSFKKQFVFVSVAEVILIYFLKPASPETGSLHTKEKLIVLYIGIAAKLMLLYVLCAITVSVLGGFINFISQDFLDNPSKYYSVEDSFKLGLIKNNLSSLAVNILSRIPVNIVDRFIVVFGGYLLSRGLRKLFSKAFVA